MKIKDIRGDLSTNWAGRDFRWMEETDSTNLWAKRIATEGAVHGTLVCAARQSAGRGRRGRRWLSEENGNIYMSILLRPKIEPSMAPMLTLVMAHSVAKALEQVCGVEVKIKWPNDLVVGAKKICGILTEMGMEMGAIAHVIIGVGINTGNADFPEELKERAVALGLEERKRQALIAACMNWFEKDYEKFIQRGSLEFLKKEYEERLINKDKMVCVLEPGNEYRGKSLGITDTGELLVKKENGEIVEVYSGEVSVRGIYGYV